VKTINRLFERAKKAWPDGSSRQQGATKKPAKSPAFSN
jgi:hypothetical protein